MFGIQSSILPGVQKTIHALRMRDSKKRPSSVSVRSQMECFISGYRFHNGIEVEHLLYQGAELELVRELANTVNPRAIAVYFQDKKLGYVTTDVSRRLAPKMDKGWQIKACVKHFRPDDPHWSRLFIGILM